MESYPGELLVGVSPLVFCVDATLDKKEEGNNINNKRSQFDKFLDTISITSSMVVDGGNNFHEGGPMMQKVEEEQSDHEDDVLLNNSGGVGGKSGVPEFSSTQRRRNSSSNNRDSSLASAGSSSSPISPNRNGEQQRDGSGNNRIGTNKLRGPFTGSRSPFSKRMSSNLPKGRSKRNSNSSSAATQRRSSSEGVSATEAATTPGNSSIGIEVPPSFAESLQLGQSFFQRARIVSSSTRHGFPPSKDPTGKSNRVVVLTGLNHGQRPPTVSQNKLTSPTALQQWQQQKQAFARLKSATSTRPIDGILPSGWLEKHAAALPSVIVVVTQIHPLQTQTNTQTQHPTQQRQDEVLLEALENLQYSLAPKRRVEIKVVAVVQEGVSPIMADQWSQGMIERLSSFLQTQSDVLTLVEERELRSMDEGDVLPASVNNPKSSPLPSLHQSIRRSSLKYYKDRSREIKGKLLRLRGPQASTNRSPILMPLLIRYCFKAAIFYEFQWKQDKSLKYMVEAYRLVETYYNYLLFWKHQRESGALMDYGEEDQEQQSEETMNLTNEEELQIPVLENSKEVDSSEGVEMSLPGKTNISAPASFDAADAPPIVVDDMIHQCRAVADWLNFKILQMCLVCQDKSGTIAASVQWQRHSKTFCCPRRSFLNTPSAPWLDWSYVAQQRLVASQLLERYPPRALGNLGDADGVNDEDLLRCSSWRSYEAAAEALLKVGHRIRTVVEKGGVSSLPPLLMGKELGANRIRYVGGIDHEGFHHSFAEESQKLHTEKALTCALRGISLYEKELEKTSKTLIPSTRSVARLYYLAGGALLGLNKRSESISHLEKAAEWCKGWSYLESLVRRLLVECYQHQDGSDIVGPLKDEDDSRQARTSFLLESYFNAGLSSDELAKALEKLVGMNGVDIGGGDGGDDRFLRWHCDFVDDEIGGSPTTPPFSFALTFPVSTHGIAGDSVKASVWIKSNLHYAVRVNRMAVVSFLGPLSIPSKDFTGDSEGVITIQPNEAIEFDTELVLPVELAQTAPDGASSAGGDKKTVAGNASAAKNVVSRARTGGFTAAGGSRYSVAEENADETPGAVPWSIRCLGGKPLRCEGLIVTFSVVSSAASDTFVKLAIEVKQPEGQPNTKRTNFDDNNYVSSAWKRPPSLPLRKGPRCLQLLSPIAGMMVTNVTEALTNGKVLEGTVNRVVLKLKAAEHETCTNVVIRAKSSSVLTTADGKEKTISLPDGEASSEDVEDTMNPRVRAPVLVKPDPSSQTFMTDFGYILPSGWALAGDGQGGDDDDDYSILAPTIKAGEETYACFDVYRPTSEPIKAYTKSNQTIVEEMTKLNDCKCETKIDISIQYQQEIINDDKSASCDDKANNSVSLDHSVTVLWSSPISVAFSSNAKEMYPSGIQHPSNIVLDRTSPKNQSHSDSAKETILIDDGKVFTKGILDPIASTDGLDIEIDKVRFSDTESENTNCKFQLLSGLDDDGTIFQRKPNNPCQTLRTGSKMSFAWMTQVSMDVYYREESLTAPIGTVSIHWKPSPIVFSEEVSFVNKDSFAGSHGPLQLARPAVCQFSGPLCHIESAPFEVIPENLPDSIKVAAPFDVAYRIRNKTPIDQELAMKLQDSPSLLDESSEDGLMIGGIVNKTTSLGPFESRSFSYTTVPMRAGKVHLPSISISSNRYKTWIIRESLERRSIYVLP